VDDPEGDYFFRRNAVVGGTHRSRDHQPSCSARRLLAFPVVAGATAYFPSIFGTADRNGTQRVPPSGCGTPTRRPCRHFDGSRQLQLHPAFGPPPWARCCATSVDAHPAGVLSLRELYGSPLLTNEPQMAMLKVLVPMLLAGVPIDPDLMRIAQIANFALTRGILFRQTRLRPLCSSTLCPYWHT
jgi:hypothetical protein